MGSLDFPFLHGHWRSSDCNCRGGSRAVFLRDVIVGHILVGHSGWLVTLPVLKAPGRSSERAPPECPFSGAKRTSVSVCLPITFYESPPKCRSGPPAFSQASMPP